MQLPRTIRRLRLPLLLACAALLPLLPAAGRTCTAQAPANNQLLEIGARARWPMPSVAEQEAADAVLRITYAQELSANTASQRRNATRRLTQDALLTYDDPAARYQLLQLVLQLYIEDNKLPLALETIEHLAHSHEIDLHAQRALLLERMLPSLETARDLQQLRATLTALIEQALRDTQFAAAESMLAAETQAAQRLEMPEFVETLAAASQEIEAARSQWQLVQQALQDLEIEPAQPHANQAVGEYLCFVRGDWEAGIPYLALGSEPKLRSAARRELRAQPTSVDLKQVGDAWWDARPNPTDPGHDQTRRRAAFWYSIAIHELSGISRSTAQERLHAVANLQDEYPLADNRYLGRATAVQTLAGRAVGANAASELAVEQGLAWLAQHQIYDGSWAFNYHGGVCDERCGDTGSLHAPYAATGLALLAFLGAGNTHQTGPYQETVAAGIQFLLGHMQYSGSRAAMLDNRGMVSHALCTLALCEAYAMSRDPALEEPAQAALLFLAQAQDSEHGGWNLKPGDTCDISIAGWANMALKTAQLAGIQTDPQLEAGLNSMLNHLEDAQQVQFAVGPAPADPPEEDPAADEPAPTPGQQAYEPTYDPRSTATGHFCRLYLGCDLDFPPLIAGADLIAQTPADTSSLYHAFFALQVLRLYQGDLWTPYHTDFRDQLVAAQSHTGHAAGSWCFPEDRGGIDTSPLLKGDIGCVEGGRLYATIMSLLILETYHRQSAMNL